MRNLETKRKDLPVHAIDPVCGMTVYPNETKLVSVREGHRYFFCAESCRESFEANPEKYLGPKSKKKKGRFGRFLDRMAKINEKEFGCSGHKCH